MADEALMLRDLGHRVSIRTPRFPGSTEWHDKLRAEGLDVDTFGLPPFLDEWPRRRINYFRARLFLPRFRRERPDLVHIFQPWTNQGLTLIWLAHAIGTDAIVSIRSTFPISKFSAWHEPFLRTGFSSVRGIFGISSSALDNYTKIFGDYFKSTIHVDVIHNFVDTERFIPSVERRETARRRFGWTDSDFVIGCVARLSAEKQPFTLIDILRTLRDYFPDVHLAFVGTGKLEADVRTYAINSGVESYVHFLGWQPQVENVLPAFDLHILMSRNEGFGTATVEAMACGVPAIATRVPGNLDVLEASDGGVLVPFGDVKVAADTIASLRADPLRRAKMGEAGRVDAITRFSKRIWQERLTAFYNQVMYQHSTEGSAR